MVAAFLVRSLRGDSVSVPRPTLPGLPFAAPQAVVTWAGARLQPVGHSAGLSMGRAAQDLRMLAVT